MEKLPDFKSEEERKAFFEAVQNVENKQGENPQEKYHIGSIQRFNKEATKDGEYKPHIDTTIKQTKDQIDAILAEVAEDKKATHSLSEEHNDPESFRERKMKDIEEDTAV